jgi:hypothetical protein
MVRNEMIRLSKFIEELSPGFVYLFLNYLIRLIVEQQKLYMDTLRSMANQYIANGRAIVSEALIVVAFVDK